MKILIYTILFTSFIVSCTKEETTETDIHSTPKIITAEYLQKNNIKQGTPILKQIANSVQVKGLVDVPPNARTIITAKTEGYIRQINVIEGSEIGSGQIVALIENPNVIVLQKNVKELQSQLVYAKQDLDRKQKLYKHEATSLKALQEAKSQVNILQTSIVGAQKELSAIGSHSGYGTMIAIPAIAGGTVTQILVKRGDYISSQTPIMEVVNHSEKHIVVEIPAQYANEVFPKLPMEITFNGKQMQGNIVKVSPEVDIEKRTITAHCHLNDHHLEYLLKPNELVSATIFFSQKEALTIPKDAVISEGDSYFVLAIKNKQVERIPVEGKVQENDFVLYDDSLKNTKLVTQGVYYLY